MNVTYQNPVQYALSLSENIVQMNDLIGQEITLQYQHQILCDICGRDTKKLFQGVCYPCFKSAPEASECIVFPERCKAQDGIGRDMDWETKNHLQDHIVYLSFTSGVKVGVTRASNNFTRWIDQGALNALVIAKTPNRYLAGCIEVSLKNHVHDKTFWKKMITQTESNDVDLIEKRQILIKELPEDLAQYAATDTDVKDIQYPVEFMPEKFKSVTFDKAEALSGTLSGIKGQYLIFKEGLVFNVRRHAGYVAALIT